MTKPQALTEIIRLLEEDIIFGRLLPRERLVEDVLMKRFAAKRHVVRQALGELQRMGIVAREQNKGALVRDFSIREIEEIYEMRALLQSHAAERIPLPADAELIRRLRDTHARHSPAVDAGDLRAVYRLNNEFHDAVFGACGNRYLTDAIAHYAWLSHAIRSYRIANPVLLAQAREEHGQIIEALEQGDRKRLVKLCVEHIYPSKNAYMATHQALDVELSIAAPGGG